MINVQTISVYPSMINPPPAHTSCAASTRQAFSLVELSIVLVILGLLVGGVLAGQSLIRAAELRAVSTEYSRYTAAVNSFKDKYFAIPGDMNNAVRFWGAQAGGTADGSNTTCEALTTPATGTATCNGNGDGQVHQVSTGWYERFRLWQHLANAGLIEGSYSGISSDGVAAKRTLVLRFSKRAVFASASFLIQTTI